MKNPLVLPEWTSEELFLVPPCPVGFDETGTPFGLDTMDNSLFGQPMLASPDRSLVWDAVTPFSSLTELRELYPFHSGAMVSPRARAIIEGFGSPRWSLFRFAFQRRAQAGRSANGGSLTSITGVMFSTSSDLISGIPDFLVSFAVRMQFLRGSGMR